VPPEGDKMKNETILYWICDDQTGAMWNSDTDTQGFEEDQAQTYTREEAEEMNECWDSWAHLREVY